MLTSKEFTKLTEFYQFSHNFPEIQFRTSDFQLQHFIMRQTCNAERK